MLDGHVANNLIVVARTGGAAGDRDGLSLVLVDSDADGVSTKRTIMADSRNAANIEFTGAEGALVGEEGKGADILDAVLDTGRIVLAAEMLAVCRSVSSVPSSTSRRVSSLAYPSVRSRRSSTVRRRCSVRSNSRSRWCWKHYRRR